MKKSNVTGKRSNKSRSIVRGLTLQKGITTAYATSLVEDWLADKSKPITQPFDIETVSTEEAIAELDDIADLLAATASTLSSFPVHKKWRIAEAIEEIGGPRPAGLIHAYPERGINFLDVLVANLNGASAALSRARASRTKKGRPTRATFVAMIVDLAGIFEHLTGRKPSRVIGHKQAGIGNPSGAFFQFVSGLWPLVPQSDGVNIDEQMRKWASLRKRDMAVSLWLLQRTALGVDGGNDAS